jgi:hypothetical protein
MARLRQNIYGCGLDPDLRAEAWAVLLGVLAAERAAREAQFVEHVATYRRISQQFVLLTPAQREMRIGAIYDILKVIGGDVLRNDRQLDAFRREDSPNLRALQRIMTAYAYYNRDAGYVQGTTDLASPFVPLFITRWIDPDRAVLFDGSVRSAEEAQVLIFAVFCAFMQLTDQDRFFTNMAVNQTFVLECRAEIAGRLRPELAKILPELELQSISSMFRALLLLFKREFRPSELLRLWDSFITADVPH